MSTHSYVLTEDIQQKWNEFIDVEEGTELKGEKRNHLTRLLENTTRNMEEEVTAGDIAKYDPILIPMMVRTQPAMVTTALIGTQPMSGPTGLVFAFHVNYVDAAGVRTETWRNTVPDMNYSKIADTATAEQLGKNLQVDTTAGTTNTPVTQTNPWPEMDFVIDKVTVTAEPRALKATFTDELATDFKAIHGGNADAELVNILHTELIAEQDREMLFEVNRQAVLGGNVLADGTTAGNTHVNVTNFDGRWAVEKYQMFVIFIDSQAHEVAVNTRRGRANFMVTTANIAGALDMAGKINSKVTFGLTAPDVTGPAYVGVLAGKYRVYVDPYATEDYVTLGYKGASQYDAGLFMAPYVPLRLYRARGENDFQPRIGFKTRYGIVSNPYFKGTGANPALSDDGTNHYFRTFKVLNVLNPV